MATVLVVDDDPDIRLLLEIRLQRRGHRVICADSAATAMTLLTGDERPDVAILDIVMYRTTGLQLLQQVRLDPIAGGIPVILLTAREMDSDIAAAAALGAQYLKKPFTGPDLIAALGTALESAPSPRG
jgi:two-component system alkaline phosphatase synthesis response regulator PhoP